MFPEGSLKDNMSANGISYYLLSRTYYIELHKNNNSQGIDELSKDAIEGGRTANFAKQQIEITLGKPVFGRENASNFTQPLLTTKDNAPK